MRIDLGWLEKHARESQQFHLRIPPGEMHLDSSDCRVLEPVEVNMEITNTGRLMVVMGEASTLLEMTCARCLKVFNQRIKVPITVELCSEKNRHHFKDVDTFIFYDEPEFDISPVVAEAIILALPLRALCSEECQGLCPVCGRELKGTPCNCAQEETDPRWEKLKRLL